MNQKPTKKEIKALRLYLKHKKEMDYVMEHRSSLLIKIN